MGSTLLEQRLMDPEKTTTGAAMPSTAFKAEATTSVHHIKFPSIGKWQDVQDNLPHVFCTAAGEPAIPDTLHFQGSVKLHGSHADLVMHGPGQGVVFQSRNRIVTHTSDQIGCVRFFSERLTTVTNLFHKLQQLVPSLVGHGQEQWPIVIGGEWCGGDIQRGVALAHLPRMFVIYSVKIGNGNAWYPVASFPELAAVLHDEENKIFSITRVPIYSLTVNVADPQPALEEASLLTEAIDAECPFCKPPGAVGAGEGVVWTCIEQPLDTRLWFKTKGPSHMTPLPLPSEIRAAKAKAQQEYELAIEVTTRGLVTTQRLAQGVEYLQEMGLPLGRQSVAAFLEWFNADIQKEHAADVEAIQELYGLNRRQRVYQVTAQLARDWFLAQYCTTPAAPS